MMGKNIQILAVDDSKTTLEILKRQIQSLSYKVHTAESGAEGLAILKDKKIDILVTDILMPGMDGIELMQKALEIRPDIECIVVSGQDEIATAVEAMKQGAINYLKKPVNVNELDISIKKCLEKIRLIQDNRKKQKELEEYRNHLEQLVEERTAELEKTNNELQQDIIARKKAEKEAEQRRKQLIEADKMVSLGILVAGVAHEINNPNNFITMNTPILQKTWETFKPILDQHYEENGDFSVGGMPYSEMQTYMPELFSGILDGSERIKKIVLNLKDYARQGISDMDQTVNINEVLKAALTLLANPLKKCTDHLKVTYTENLPTIKGNFQRVEQVLINIIQNACQSLDERSKSIEITTYHDKKDDSVIVSVKDEGSGIPKKYLKRIRDPFFTTKRDTGGTGLGLSISAGIMDEHDGRLAFNSLPDEGTTVSAIFPVLNDS